MLDGIAGSHDSSVFSYGRAGTLAYIAYFPSSNVYSFSLEHLAFFFMLTVFRRQSQTETTPNQYLSFIGIL